MSKPRGKRALRAVHPRNCGPRKSFERVRELDLGPWPMPGDFSPLPREPQPTPERRKP